MEVKENKTVIPEKKRKENGISDSNSLPHDKSVCNGKSVESEKDESESEVKAVCTQNGNHSQSDYNSGSEGKEIKNSDGEINVKREPFLDVKIEVKSEPFFGVKIEKADDDEKKQSDNVNLESVNDVDKIDVNNDGEDMETDVKDCDDDNEMEGVNVKSEPFLDVKIEVKSEPFFGVKIEKADNDEKKQSDNVNLDSVNDVDKTDVNNDGEDMETNVKDCDDDNQMEGVNDDVELEGVKTGSESVNNNNEQSDKEDKPMEVNETKTDVPVKDGSDSELKECTEKSTDDIIAHEIRNVKKIEEKNDSEKENVSNNKTGERVNKNTLSSGSNKETKDNDIEIIGESKLIRIDSPSTHNSPSQNVVLLNPGYPPNFNANSPNVLSNNSFSPASVLSGGYIRGASPFLSAQGSSAAPPKPKSSLDQIELIRWEIQNRLNTRPKYFKPNPTAELGSLAKFLFEIGSNLIKEAVYHELVKIQSKKNDENTLSEKEKEDLSKLKDIEKDLYSTIGHLKLKMKKKCKACHFQTESSSVLYHHKQYPHEDEKKLHCAYCSFVSKQTMNFKFHLESEHGVQPKLHDKKSFWECDLCPYENNQEQKLVAHKVRCAKQFRPLFNLHPSCLSGAEINLCLENIFYKPVIPKNLKLLQQKHAQQQAALAEARRQQAEIQAIAAQKNAAAQAAKRQRQIIPSPATPQRFNTPNHNTRQVAAKTQGPTMPAVRYNSRPVVPQSVVRPTVANLLKDKPNRSASNTATQHSAPVGFEVCEICGGYVKDRKALRIHFFYAHRIDLPFHLFDRHQPPLYCATCYVRFWTAQGLRKHIDVHVQEKKIPDGFMSEGVHGKCISCGQLVGNIVVHMRVVHNREIHHYINALMCMFCGASFNSRANVERHITEVHGTIDIATGAVKVKAKVKNAPQPAKQPPNNVRKSGSNKDSLVKGSVCVLCNLNFGRNVDLTRHCMRMHHTCMKCGMVVIDKASLLKHTCLSSPSGTRDCCMCLETGFHPAYYVKHLRDKHLKKFCITVARVSSPVISKWIKRPYPDEPAADCVEISDSNSDDDSAEASAAPLPKPAESQEKSDDSAGPCKKKARVGPASRIGREKLSEDELAKSSSCATKRKSSESLPPEAEAKKQK